ncbi:ABC transporter ATP-binding protein [Rhizobium sp. KVB221]|uniref:ABC transporter ATP-binding protein n=1 Tax=Rhizobium setariae TaxID=2801340 RepID=A0A937CQC2_9HYPH|nr:ABC transporter ATP-binding protein [Rhizobium setariae]MBL0373688.1 ABC transporter ATP-binding protein [Rhizobium setariae]
MLKVEGFNSYYDNLQVLRDFSVSVAAGEILCLLGRNGAGKTTALKSIIGIVPPRSGRIELDGLDISSLAPEAIPRQGIGYVPQGRRLFKELTVRENLEIGLMTRKSGPAALERALSYFPALGERMGQQAGTLSGGEQTMVAIARALCIEPKVIMLDEPTEGLMPSMIAAIRDVVTRLRHDGVAVLLVEQRIDAVLPVADRIAFMDHGVIQAQCSVDEVRNDPTLVQKYLGVGH